MIRNGKKTGIVPDERIRARVLESGLQQLRVPAGLGQRDKLLRYLDLLARWNARFNLTAVRDTRDMVPRHLLDSAAALAHVQGPRLLDAGSGAGLPGLVLAILAEHLDVVLADRNGKKTRFLVQAVAELALENVAVVRINVRDYAPEPRFDTIITRAVGKIDQWTPVLETRLKKGGRLVYMKGRESELETQGLAGENYHIRSERLHVPGLCGARHVVIVEPVIV